MLSLSDTWRTTYPGASQGVLVMHNLVNPDHHAELETQKVELEKELRARFVGYDRAAFSALPSIQPYIAYYAKFKKTYHVQLQLESVVLKGKSIPSVAALVETMFMTELTTQLLTAGHDLDTLQGSPRLDIARGDEHYVMLNGKEETLKAGDMFMADSAGVISSILYGPDRRTCISTGTRNAVFTVYAPPGIDPGSVRQHLEAIQARALLIAPTATVESLEVYVAE